ncbi:hypothetical protein G7Y89_g4780 [Cudoniella acicularis]|uniref:Uncharacterized protein n=1 Tax=Cudoniella acicularis TaxID=354080 RepID=A0A8H4RQY1_9HELO|nr:hypothetical protein G7Y89_g4780 [Cudoniella acicularis]
MHFHNTIIVLILAWHAACQLPMDLWQENASTEWAAKPTWHKEQDNVGILDFNGVRDLAQNYFNWLVQQPSALTSNGNPADVMVAVFYDADQEATFASSIPRGPRKAFMTKTVQQAAPNNFAPIWYEKAKGIFDAGTGHNPLFRDAPIHAEDGAYFNWETSIHAALANNYPPGSIVAIWRRPFGRTPTCLKVAQDLDVVWSPAQIQGRQLVEQVPDASEEGFDDVAAEACGAVPASAKRLGKRQGAERRQAAASSSISSITTLCTMSPQTSLYTATLANSLPASDYSTSIATITAAPSTAAPAPTTLSCSPQESDPDKGINLLYCVCEGSVTLSVQTRTQVTAPVESCAFTTLPGASAQITTAADLGPVSTNTAMCEVCTPVVNNEDSCSIIPGCVIQTSAVTVFAGTSPVLVGTLTGSALYTSVSKALETLCPTVSQTMYMTNYSTDTVTIGNIDFIDSSDELDSGGELQITVESSEYNVTSTRDAIIQSVALTVQNAATGSNRYSVGYNVEEAKKRDVGFFSWFSGLLDERDRPYMARANTTFCQTVGFASVGYYGPYWPIYDMKLPTNYIYPYLSFLVGPGGDFLCELLNEIVDAFAVVEPEFAIGDIELGEAIDLLCTDSDEGE